MKVEMGYKFKGSGHEVPEERREYKQPDSRLVKAFEAWVKTTAESPPAGISFDETIRQAIGDFEFSVDDVTALIYQFEGHEKMPAAGLFLSRLYSKAKGEVIIFDPGVEMTNVAYELPKNKIFVNKTPRIGDLGEFSEGKIINYGLVRDNHNFGYRSRRSGTLLNYGAVSTGPGNSDALFINAGKVLNLAEAKCTINLQEAEMRCGFSSDVVVNLGSLSTHCVHARKIISIKETKIDHFEHCNPCKTIMLTEEQSKSIPELMEYFDRLKQDIEAGRNDHDKAIEAIRKLSAEQVLKDLERIVTSAGYKW